MAVGAEVGGEGAFDGEEGVEVCEGFEQMEKRSGEKGSRKRKGDGRKGTTHHR